MPIQQLYYTSCRNPVSSRTGFQVKAESRGISQDATDTLSKIMGYRIPPSLATQPITMHPVALRYYVLKTQEAILLCSQSNGVDEFDRPGNYFAHALVGNPSELADPLPPITYWKNPFWVNRDDSNQIELPTLEAFNPDILFDFDAVWAFVNAPIRREWFRELLGAVVDYGQSSRRIIILDDIEHIVQWIYAVSLALPPRYRPQLTFTTYHHDPYVAPFIITGTTADSSFRFTRDEYTNYFVINAPENQISKSPPSDFVNYICERFNEKQYNNEILEFFDWFEAGRTNQRGEISKRLNDLTNFYMATVKMLTPRDSARAVSGTLGLVDELIQSGSSQPNDVEDLNAGVELLADALVKTENIDLVSSYNRALVQLKRVYPSVAKTCDRTCRAYAAFVLKKQMTTANELDKLMAKVYTPNDVQEAINRPDVLHSITQAIRSDDSEQVTAFWTHIGKWMSFDPATHNALIPAFQTTFAALQIDANNNPLIIPPKSIELLSILLNATRNQPDLLLKMAHEYQQYQPTNPILKWVYYALVEQLPLKQRQEHFWSYWELFQDVPLFDYEIQRDLMKQETVSKLMAVMVDWVGSFAPQYQPEVFVRAFNFIWEKRGMDLTQFAKHLLITDKLEQLLDTQRYSLLVETALKDAKIDFPDVATSKLYERFATIPQLSLPLTTRAVIEGALALARKKFPNESAIPGIREYFEQADTQSYEQQTGKLMEQFFGDKSSQTHYHLIMATYIKKHRDAFWALYWDHFQKNLLEKRRFEVTLNILEIWFNQDSALYRDYPYAVPEFFTELLNVLELIRGNKNYNTIKRDFESRIVGKDWYPVIQKAFHKSKGLLGGLFER